MGFDRVGRLGAVAAAFFVVTLSLPFVVSRELVRLERHGRTWTLTINGQPKGSIEEPDGPFPVTRIGLFLTGEAPLQRWRTVHVASSVEKERRSFSSDGLGTWQGDSSRWKTDFFGAMSPSAAESVLRRSFPTSGDLLFEATMVAGSEGGILVEGDDPPSRLRLWMRPEQHHDAYLTLHRAGAEIARVYVGPVGLSQSFIDLCAQVLRIAFLALVAGVVLLVLRRWRGTAALPPAPRWLALFAVIGAGVLAFVSLRIERVVFDSMPHVQDAVSLIFQARNFALGRVTSPSPPEARFFDHEFVINNGLWFGKYPPGASALYAIGLLAGELDLVNPLLGAASVLLLYALGRRIYGGFEGMLAVAFFVCSPIVLRMNASYLSHPASLFFALGFLVLYFGPASTPHYGLAGLSLGAMLLTRPQTAAALAFPFAIDSADRFLRDRSARRPVIVLASGVLAGGVLFALYDLATTGSIWVTPFQLYSPSDRLGFGSVGVEWGLDFGIEQAFSNLSTNLTALGPAVSGRSALFLALPLLRFLVVPVERREVLLALSALSIVSLFFFYFHHGVFLGPRYWYETTPALFLFAARGLCEIGGALGALWPKGSVRRWLALGATLAATAVFVVSTARKAYEEIPGDRGLNGLDGHPLAMAKDIPGRAIVFVDSGRSWQHYGAVFWTLWPDLDRNRIIWAREAGSYNVHPERPPLPDSLLTARFPDRAAYRMTAHGLAPLVP